MTSHWFFRQGQNVEREAVSLGGLLDIDQKPTRLRQLALFGPHAMSDLRLECAPKRTSANHSEFMG